MATAWGPLAPTLVFSVATVWPTAALDDLWAGLLWLPVTLLVNLPLLATVGVYLALLMGLDRLGRRPRGMRRSSFVSPSRAAAGRHRLIGTQRHSPDQGGASLPHRILLFRVSFGGDCPAPATSSPEKDPPMRLLPTRTREWIEAANSITEVVRPLERQADVPGLGRTGRGCLRPGTPGHVAYLRRHDGALLTGDAALTVDLNSVGGVLLGQQRVASPPWYTTWNWPAGKRLVEVLADLEPRVLASGHGRPFRVGTAAALHARPGPG
jgi:hypothetical protein